MTYAPGQEFKLTNNFWTPKKHAFQVSLEKLVQKLWDSNQI